GAARRAGGAPRAGAGVREKGAAPRLAGARLNFQAEAAQAADPRPAPADGSSGSPLGGKSAGVRIPAPANTSGPPSSRALGAAKFSVPTPRRPRTLKNELIVLL